jgi:hypothetical protein
LPSYYAPGTNRHVYDVQGSGFLTLPDDVIVIISDDNDNPLKYLNDTRSLYRVGLVMRTNDHMLFEQDTTHGYSTSSYMGAIVSSDRRTVYWVNESKPLP